jgi:hypothetical protein
MLRDDLASQSPTRSAQDSLARIWGRLARPLNPHGAVAALVGVPPRVTRYLVGGVIAASDEADVLLEAMPELLRSLSIATVSVPERCVNEVRGPILWSETLGARAASAGDQGLFVVQKSSRAYDTPENRVLVAALRAIRRGGDEVVRLRPDNEPEDELFRRAKINGIRARRFLEHRALAGVSPRGAGARGLQRVRSGGRRRLYEPMLAVLARAAEPLEDRHLRPFCDPRTTAQHDLLVAAVNAVQRRGYRVPTFHTDHGMLTAGLISFRHPGADSVDQLPHGVRIGDILLDVPDPIDDMDHELSLARLAARAGDRRFQLVTNRGDVERAAQLALETGLY